MKCKKGFVEKESRCVPIMKNMPVTLKDDVLPRHASSVPEHAGYTTEQFRWRDTLRDLKGEIGIIERTFEGSKHVNVYFPKEDVLVGISSTELDAVPSDSPEFRRGYLEYTSSQIRKGNKEGRGVLPK